MPRPTPQPGQVYRHCFGNLVVIYGIAKFKAEPAQDVEIYSALSLEFAQELAILIGIDGELYHSDRTLPTEIVVYFCHGFCFSSLPYFLGQVNSPGAADYYRYGLFANEEQAHRIGELIGRYDLSTKPLEVCQ